MAVAPSKLGERRITMGFPATAFRMPPYKVFVEVPKAVVISDVPIALPAVLGTTKLSTQVLPPSRET
jgi:hypothetical protein